VKLSVVMPVFNEVGTLEEAIKRVRGVRFPKEIVVVDDASTDGSRELLVRLERDAGAQEDPLNEIRVILQPVNRGKGAAIRAAVSAVGGDVVIIQDADLEYDPQDYPRLLEPILAGKADVVYGTRFHGGGPHRVLFFWHYLGNQLLTFFSNMLTNLNLSDMEVGYKVFRTDVLRSFRIRSNRFGFEPEVTVKVAKKGYRIYEIPISYHGRTYAEGKKITWKDGIVAFYSLVRYSLRD
jgi:glycosyltransferase involved in cell wall biosynthesis